MRLKRLNTRRFPFPLSANDSVEHHKLALQASRESLVLLKNDRILPINKNIKAIAVIGANADDKEVLMGNYNGKPSQWMTVLDGIKHKVSPNTKVLFSRGLYQTGESFEPVSAEAFGGSLKAEYFNNQDFSGQPVVVRNDPNINFFWSNTVPPEGIIEKNFAVRWTGKLIAPETGKYDFGWRGRGFLKVWLDGKIVLEESKNARNSKYNLTLDFSAGKTYDLKVEYVENKSDSSASRLIWSPPSAQAKLRQSALEIAKQAEVVVLAMGITPAVEGEEMDVSVEGFRRGDRTDIDLPKPQQELIKEIYALGKPVVLVTMGGSALALNWENENLLAILHAWYPGQFGGQAIADVLFGDFNPSGRLPVTFYKSVNDLPPFEDYKMEGKTYRYFRKTPLYPFGYGLSFSKFQYGNMKFKKSIKAGESLTVSVEVKNESTIAGDEVVQLYLSDTTASVPVPIRNLAGVQKIPLQAGEKRRVNFTISPRQMSIFLDNNKRVVEPGEFSVSIGGTQPGFANDSNGIVEGKFEVTGKSLEIQEK